MPRSADVEDNVGPDPDHILEVHGRLRVVHGPRPWNADSEPVLDSLIRAILSQSTSDVNSHRAFGQLRAAFPSWEDARQSGAAAIEMAIRSGGLARTKAQRIDKILSSAHRDNDETSLEHLREASTARIKAELSALPGVGPKTIACVLMFNLGRPDFPVDTHIHRISKRLGWVPAKASEVDWQAVRCRGVRESRATQECSPNRRGSNRKDSGELMSTAWKSECSGLRR